MAKPVYTNEQIIDQVDNGGYWYNSSYQVASTITYGIPTNQNWFSTSYAEYSGWSALNTKQAAIANLGFELWNDVIAVDLVAASDPNTADIRISNSTTGVSYAHAYGPGEVGIDNYAYQKSQGSIWLNNNYYSLSDPDIGEYGQMAIMHEIGHTLGLSHPGNYNGGSPTYQNDALFEQDTHMYSIMSYFDASNTGADWYASDGLKYYAQTPMVYDVLTAQSIYGADYTTRSGDTVYGFNTTEANSVFDFTFNQHPIITIWDGAGNDTIDLSGWTTNSTITLVPGSYSNADQMTFNIAIAYGADIENAIGGGGNDILTGNDLNNQLMGNSGDDVLNGGNGNDVLFGGLGSDTALYSSNWSDYVLTSFNSEIAVLTTGADGLDLLQGIENLQFLDQTFTAGSVTDFQAYDYIASNTGLITSLGANAQAGFEHYVASGFTAGLATDSFDAAQYLANYADLTAAYGSDLDAATLHFITTGFNEGRTDQIIAGGGISAISDQNASGDSINENASVGTIVGITALATDPDAGDSVTYTLSNDAGGLFTIDANTGVVRVAGSLDAESSTTQTIEVTATSSDSTTSTQTFSINVNDVNETSISIVGDSNSSGNTVNEGAAIGSAVGITAFASDADLSDTVTYSLSNNAGGLFAIDGSTGVVSVAAALDFETSADHTIEVTATSSDGSTSTQTFTIDVTNLFDEGPTDITLTGGIVDENAAAGTVVAALTTLDPDSSDSFSYQILNDPSGALEIVGNQIQIKAGASLDYEAGNTQNPIELTFSANVLNEAAGGLDVAISGIPAGAILSAGVDNGDGSWTVPGASVSGLTLTPPAGHYSEITLSASVGAATNYVNSGFAAGNDGFTFNDTAAAYSSSNISGDLGMVLGGVDHNDITNMEASWSKGFTVTEAGAGALSFDYRMIMSSEYETDEFGEIRVKIDGQLVTFGANQYATQISGDGNGGPVVDTDWQTISVDLGDLSAGAHTIEFIGFNNKKTFSNETTEVRFDNILLDVDGMATDISTVEPISTYDVLVQTTDSGGNTYSETMTLNVNDLNEGPADITYSGGVVIGSAEAGMLVATLATVDPDAGDSFTYQIINDPSSALEIIDNEIRIKADYVAPGTVLENGGFNFNDIAGSYSSSNTSGDLGMVLGGIDHNDITNMEASWSKGFTVTDTGAGALSFDYRMIMSSEYETDEFGEVSVKIDGQLVTFGAEQYVTQISGDGNGGPVVDTGWQTINVDLGDLSAGAHTIEFIGYNNKKTFSNETTEVRFDNILLNVDTTGTGASAVEPSSIYDITVQSTDSGGSTYSEVLSLDLNDLNASASYAIYDVF